MTNNQKIWAEAYKENLDFKSVNAYMTYEERINHEEKLQQNVDNAWSNLTMGEVIGSTEILMKVLHA